MVETILSAEEAQKLKDLDRSSLGTFVIEFKGQTAELTLSINSIKLTDHEKAVSITITNRGIFSLKKCVLGEVEGTGLGGSGSLPFGENNVGEWYKNDFATVLTETDPHKKLMALYSLLSEISTIFSETGGNSVLMKDDDTAAFCMRSTEALLLFRWVGEVFAENSDTGRGEPQPGLVIRRLTDEELIQRVIRNAAAHAFVASAAEESVQQPVLVINLSRRSASEDQDRQEIIDSGHIPWNN